MQLTVIVYTLLILFMILCLSQGRGLFFTNSFAVAGDSYKLKSVGFCSAMLAFAIVFGIRFDVGVDHLQYVDDYLFGKEYNNFELLYTILNNACALLKLPYPVLFTIISLIQVAFFFASFRKEFYLFPYLVIFLFFNDLTGNWNNIIRASLAFCIWCYSLNYIAEKNLVKYLIFSVLAIGFHTSAIILVVSYPILVSGRNYFRSVPIQFLLLALAFVIRYLFWNFTGIITVLIDYFIRFVGNYSGYTADRLLYESIIEEGGTGLGFYANILVNAYIIAISPKLQSFYYSRKFIIVYNLFFVGLLLQYMFPTGFIALTRPFRYFYMLHPVMLAYVTYYLFKSRNSIFLLLILVLYTGIFYGSIIRSNESAHKWYQTCFQHKEVPLTPSYRPTSLVVN